ncbi:hypothetical protein H5P28_19555 [Ruficoccus amylovorans]|uniref:LamG-like jellyroll fold domain-containing protein n=1 Tax=Ruficoccus amylovorans TaxID=1804625 RepID=A0A842HJ79_9BACT|nr:thrombospondin type 3 repeat-containing protein [Ruficoccus amylovorans]MBC2595424.1 hypothetical protein [Ruficoccus amylovorans]MBC2595674.1 hypothetical protein [Ruficoccus amylovorans]MBC2595680.1 hypothetical protein [Ruficoccus amylovorans]MBC2596471.1 hypothetical protein [Ruficoccus amylovorans]
MFRVSAAVFGLSLALFTGPLSGQVSLPYETDFESAAGYVPGNPPGLAPWSAGGSGAVVTAVDSASAAQSILFPDGVSGFLRGSFGGAQPGAVTFVDFYLKPMAGSQESLPQVSSTETSAMTGVVESAGAGWLYAVHGDGQGGGEWQLVPRSFALNDGVSTNWIRLTYRLNYATKTWDLYLDEDLVATDLGFIDDVLESFSSFRLKGGGLAPVYFDFFYAGYDNPIFLDSDGDGMSDAYEIASGLNPNMDDRYGDLDFDGIANIHEFLYDLAAGNPDSDGDGVHDGWEFAFGGDPAAADNYTLAALPYTDSFENHPTANVTSAGGWAYQGGNEPQLSSAEAAAGSYSVFVNASTSSTALYNLFTAVPDTVVWVDFALKPGMLAEEPALSAATSAGFYFNDEGLLRAFDGAVLPMGGWQTLAHEHVQSDQWQRLTVQLNYTTQRWAVYLNGVRLANGLGFANAVPFFQSFRMTESEGGETYLDAVQVGYTEPADLDNDGDGLSNAWEIAAAAHGYDPENAYSADPTGMVRDDYYDLDRDGLGTLAELAAGTDFTNPDTDGDGLLDGAESTLGEDPLVAGSFNALSADSNGIYSWQAGFEPAEGYSVAALSGQNRWRTDSALVTVSAAQAQAGTQSVTLETAASEAVSAEQWLASPVGASVVWVSFYAKLTPGGLPDLSQRETLGAAYFTTDEAGTLHVYDGGSSQWLDAGLAVNAANWMRFDVRLDYAAKTWSLWADATEVALDVGFANTAIAGFTRVRFEQLSQSESQGFIDSLRVSTAMPAELSPWGMVPEDWKQALVDADDSDAITSTAQVLPGDDYDGDGLSNEEEFRQGKSPTVADADVLYYVSADTGNDVYYNGLSLYPGQPSSLHGPKATLSGVFAAAADESRILVQASSIAYDETTLNLNGKNLTLRPNGDVTLR